MQYLFGFNMGHIHLLICCHALNKMIIKVFYFYSNLRYPCDALCEEQIQIQTIHKLYASPSSVAIVTDSKFAVKKFYIKFYGSDIKRSLALASFVIDCDMPCFRS